MDKVKTQISETVKSLEILNTKYHFSNTGLDEIQNKLPDFKYRLPLIGEFSSGKTSLINNLLGEDLFKVQGTAETALPHEISFGETEKFSLILKDGTERDLNRTELIQGIKDDTKGSRLVIRLPHIFLKQIKSLCLVDMPGFNSGYEVHNRVIDDYMIDSLSYLLILSVEDGLTQKGIDLLKELTLYDASLNVLINKSDLRQNLDEIVRNNKKNIKRFLKKDPDTVETVSVFNNQIENFSNLLLSLESKSSEQCSYYFKRLLSPEKNNLIQSLQFMLAGSDADISELEELEQTLKHKLEDQNRDVDRKKVEIKKNFNGAVHKITSSINSRLQSQTDQFAEQLSQGIDIKHSLNMILRTQSIEGLKEYFISPSEDSLSSMVQGFNTIFSDVNFKMNLSKGKGNPLEDNLKKAATEALGIAMGGTIGTFFGPFGTVIGALLGSLLDNVLDHFFKVGREAKRKEEIKTKLLNIYPAICNQVNISLLQKEEELVQSVINPFVEQMNKKEESILASLAELRKNIEDKVYEHSNYKRELEEDIIFLESLNLSF